MLDSIPICPVEMLSVSWKELVKLVLVYLGVKKEYGIG